MRGNLSLHHGLVLVLLRGQGCDLRTTEIQPNVPEDKHLFPCELAVSGSLEARAPKVA